ncbi:MAG TPA: tetratricopeptide repeat protein [Pyrinomonadaceae bacterium]|nr:tetratricopeptide repeat protein [Pyrinomonadaceae bacterium]
MREKPTTILVTALAVVALLFGVRAVLKSNAPRAEEAARRELAPAALDSRATPADRRIEAAQVLIKKAPDSLAGYNALAAAFMQKARETGDFGYNARAEEALKRSEEVAPDNQGANRLRAYLLLAYHRFGEAREAARRAVAQNPRDYEAYGALVDAHVELGQYDEARRAVQAMLDVRPYTASYARASYLRSLHGDTVGAIEAMRLAVASADPGDPEALAWCLVHLGDELVNAGKPSEAEREYDRALFYFPDYPLALNAKARARAAAGDTEAAVALYQKSLDRTPSPEAAVALGDIYAKLGKTVEAKRQYELVEFVERAGAAAGTYSRQLAVFWADHDTKLDEALEIARRERERRADIHTSDALAWCLYKKGQLAEAKAAIDEALRLGTRDARLLYHAGMIYRALDDRGRAAKYLKAALDINPQFDVLQAEAAKRALRDINA